MTDPIFEPDHTKEKISIRIDPDILAWFKKDGPRWQTRINDVLRAYMLDIPKDWGVR